MLRNLDGIIFYAHDLDTTVKFYQDMGLPLVLQQLGETPPFYTAQLDSGISLIVDAVTPDDDQPEYAAGATQISFRVEDLDTAIERALDKGAQLHAPKLQTHYGTRAILEDPDKRLIELVEK